MTTNRIRVGLMGPGRRLRNVLQLVLNLDPARSIQVVAAFDPDPGVHRELKALLGSDYLQADSEEALAALELDWIFVGSWNVHHARQAILALDAGKNVFCEKPLATNLEDCLAIREAVERSGRTFFFGLVLRYSAHYQKIHELLQANRIGKIISFEFNETLDFNHGGYIFGNWRRDPARAGSHALEKCCHDLDLANWISGSLPLRIASFGGKDFFKPENRPLADRLGKNAKGLAAYSTWPDPHRKDPFDGKAGIFDNQVVILEYANGTRATFHMNGNAALPERRFYLCGTEGALRADLVAGTIEVKKIGWETGSEMINVNDGDLHGGGDAVMAAALLQTMLTGAPPLASVKEGLESAISAFGIDQAIANGGLANLDDLWVRAGIDPANR